MKVFVVTARQSQHEISYCRASIAIIQVHLFDAWPPRVIVFFSAVLWNALALYRAFKHDIVSKLYKKK